jgi:ABC-2 type transport system permease protein
VAIIVFLLYGQLFGYGMAVGSGIVEQKASRVVEVLLAKVTPAQLLAGKVLGIGLLGLAQLLLITLTGGALAFGTGLVELPRDSMAAIAVTAAWFVPGYAFYACVFAVAGGARPRQEELQNSLGPLTFAVFGAIAVAIAALRDPSSTLARIASFVPPTAPMVLPIRMADTGVAAWEIVVALLVMMLSVVSRRGAAHRLARAPRRRLARRRGLAVAAPGEAVLVREDHGLDPVAQP